MRGQPPVSNRDAVMGLLWSQSGPRYLAHRLVLLGVFGFLALVMASSNTHVADAQTLDLAGYRQVIQSSLTTLRNDPGSATEVANNLEAISGVRPTTQSMVKPDLSMVVSYLDAKPARVADAEAALSAILAHLDRAQNAGANTQRLGNADASLQSILARSEFNQKPSDASPSLTGWILHQLRRLLGPVLAPVGRFFVNLLRGVMPSPTVWVIGMGVVGLLAIAVVIAGPIRSIRRGFGPSVARHSIGIDSARLSAAELRDEADALARNNSYRLAIRTLYLAALMRLDERGVLRFDRSLTNREVLKTAATMGELALADRLAPLVNRFDRCWYGADTCSEQDYDEFTRLSRWAWETV